MRRFAQRRRTPSGSAGSDVYAFNCVPDGEERWPTECRRCIVPLPQDLAGERVEAFRSYFRMTAGLVEFDEDGVLIDAYSVRSRSNRGTPERRGPARVELLGE